MRSWWRENGPRFVKYALLFIALAVTIEIVFNGFSNYISRRAFEVDLDGKSAPNFELLEFMSRRERALATATLETRCTERNEIALFRILDADTRQRLNDAYFRTLQWRSGAVLAIEQIKREHQDWAEVVDLDGLDSKVRHVASSMSLLEKQLQPVKGIAAGDPRYQEFSDQVVKFILAATKRSQQQVQEYESARSDAERKLGPSNIYFKNIELLEQRLQRLKEQRLQNRKALGLDVSSTETGRALQNALGDLLARYTAWKEAQLGASDNNPILDEIAVDLGASNQTLIDHLKCERFDQLLATIGDRSVFSSFSPAAASFKMPLIAQTLFVTLLLGAMGALTINVLRLSKIGWWREQDEPAWGELLLSPFVGALAAFCIFLLGSTGLLLTSDVKTGQSGITSLSAFFIGLLGFVSGLLYDEAFGRVRRFGVELFGSDDGSVAATPEDRSLAEALRDAGASYAAELVLAFNIGKRLIPEAGFTLLVPADEAMGRLTLAAWKDISGPTKRAKFEIWFRRHHATSTVNKSDVTAGTATEIEMESSDKYPLEVAGDDLLVNKVKVVQAGVMWGNGVIHVLTEDLT